MPTRMLISKAEFCRTISARPSTFLGTSRGIVDAECIDLRNYHDPAILAEIREATVCSCDIVFTGDNHLGISNKDFYRYTIGESVVLACTEKTDCGITCYYLMRN